MESVALIVTYNSARVLPTALLALGSMEVVVVDNGSTDGSAELATRAGVHVIRIERNLGLSAATNRGLAQIDDRRPVLLLNPDVVVSQEGIRSLEHHCHEGRAGLIAPILTYKSGFVQESARRFPSLLSLAGRRFGRNGEAEGQQRVRERTELALEEIRRGGVTCFVDWVLGAAMMVSPQARAALGGFDERFFLYNEDIDFCARAWSAHMPVAVDGTAVFLHHYARESRRTFDLRTAQTRHHWNSVVRFFLKYPKFAVGQRPFAVRMGQAGMAIMR